MGDELAPAKVTLTDRAMAVQRRREEMYVRGDKGAARRGMSHREWVLAELERDWNTLI